MLIAHFLMQLVDTSQNKSFTNLIKAAPPRPFEKLTIRLLIVVGVLNVVLFTGWFFDATHVGHPVLFWLLAAGLAFKLCSLLFEWYNYFSISVPAPPALTKQWSVDILTTACPGEPHEMIIQTLQACQNITYPHQTYLCDEGNDPYLRQVCEELGVVHVIRSEKTDAKAGNINNALRQATGEVCLILDPDHVPVPEFLDRVLPYFEDPQIGFVQVVQAYGNQLRNNLVAKGAAQQTYGFYGPMMMSMNTYGTVQAIGANCTFRREAIDSIGGHAAGLAEDMHTAMQLYAKGWKSVYVPELLSRGLVPATLPAYYKQQLKWARGTFELLFTTYFNLCRSFTWQQKIHYFLVPLYYLYGVFGLIDIAVPIASLLTGEVPWKGDFMDLWLYFTPVLGLSILIRQYAQRWYLEEHERGFHILGGVLRTGTWWVFLLGFVYTIFRVRVPYIPTPKDDKPTNNVPLSIPNLLACFASIGAIVYGLSIDWSVYTLFMAGFALTNTLVLGFTVLLGQHKFLINFYSKFAYTTIRQNYLSPLRSSYRKTSRALFAVIQRGTVAYMFLIILTLGGYVISDKSPKVKLQSFAPPQEKYQGGFYAGIYLPQTDSAANISPLAEIERTLNTSFNIVSLYQSWGPESLQQFPDSLLQQIYQKGSIPMITWEPNVFTFPQSASHPELRAYRKTCKAISEGFFDDYIKAYASRISALNRPIFIRFAHEPDNPAYTWSPAWGNTADEYRAAWQHVVKLFADEGLSNVTWVWNPWKHDTMHTYYPGSRYVDWIGVTALNYGSASHDGKWRSFEEIYKPFRKELLSLKKPVMLAEFGSTGYGGDQTRWIQRALVNIRVLFPEIRSLVFFNSNRDKNWITPWRPGHNEPFIDWTFRQPHQVASTLDNYLFLLNGHKPLTLAVYPTKKPKAPIRRASAIRGGPGGFQLLQGGTPFYVKGVAYNPGQDWRDGDYPLTRKQLEQDLEAIKAMGANTIRRYHPGQYDINILKIAAEQDLKVLFGFWFDPKIDYSNDSAKVEQYIRDVQQAVKTYKDYPAVLGWTMGSDTWSALSNYYGQPYLFGVREAYVRMIERIAEKIHEIDPVRPVFTSMEHNWQLPGELYSLRQNAPSIDVIGVNSFYHRRISVLDQLMQTHAPDRPYLVAAFGPKGFWDPEYSSFKRDTLLVEDSDYQNAMWYAHQWSSYIEPYGGRNLGGIAFCWRDRLEGTATWFGLTDFKGRFKTTYYALQKKWAGTAKSSGLHDVLIVPPDSIFIPGATYTFRAVTENDLSKGLQCEWYLCREEYLEREGKISPLASGMNVQVTIPKEPSRYRLYLYISDERGNVVTASEPIPVQ